jgi:hypothetical protein
MAIDNSVWRSICGARRGLAIAGLALLIAGCGGGTASPTTSAAGTPTPASTATALPTATPTVAPTPVPTPTPTPRVGAWTLGADSASLKKIQFITVVWTGTRFAAGGVLMNGSAVFLDSADGLAWHLQTPSWSNATIRRIAVSSSGLVAVGDRAGRMLSWTSADGLAWTLTPDATSKHPASGDSLKTWGVAPWSGGWIAVGEEDPTCMTGCIPVRAVVWTSPDGAVWTQAAAAPELATAGMQAVTPWQGGYVAVGRAGKYAAVWTSTDGNIWARVPDTAAFHAPAGTDQEIGAGMAGVAGSGSHVVAVGQVFTQGAVGSALAWSETVGGPWASATGDKFLHGQMFAVAAVPTGFLAVGPSGLPSCRGGIWSSADGTAWKCEASAAGFEGFAPYDAASSPTREIVVGFGRPGGALTGSVWYRELTTP